MLQTVQERVTVAEEGCVLFIEVPRPNDGVLHGCPYAMGAAADDELHVRLWLWVRKYSSYVLMSAPSAVSLQTTDAGPGSFPNRPASPPPANGGAETLDHSPDVGGSAQSVLLREANKRCALHSLGDA